MHQEFPTIEITPVSKGVYRVFSGYDKESIAFTGQALVELAAWIADNRETLKLEAEQEEAQNPTGASVLLSNETPAYDTTYRVAQ